MTSRTFWAKWGRLLFTVTASLVATPLLFSTAWSPGFIFGRIVLGRLGLARTTWAPLPAMYAFNFAGSFAVIWWLLSLASDSRDDKDDVGSGSQTGSGESGGKNGLRK